MAVYEPALDLVTHVFLSPDGHASERTLFVKVLTVVRCKDLWIADRNFSTREFLLDLAEAEGSFIIRQHGSMAFTLLGNGVREVARRQARSTSKRPRSNWGTES